MRIDHFVLVTDDVARLCAFWRRVLGARVVDLGEWLAGRAEYPYLLFDGWKVNVHDARSPLKPVAGRRVVGSADVCLQWDAPLDRALELLREQGVHVELGPVTQLGARGWANSVYFRDPDGNLIELISYEGSSA
jgi:catechol 2,3-dioxygenase-like lactoylglutathione lyase family enzyme